MNRTRQREIAARAIMSHAQRMAECMKRRPDLVIVVGPHTLTARWTEHDGPAKQVIARVVLAEEMLIRACLAIIMHADEQR